MDRELRQAERTGNKASLLRARMRSGQITWERVKLAAQLGNPTALTLFPDEPPTNWEKLKERKQTLKKAEKELGKPRIVEFTADMAERVLQIFEAQHPEDKRPREAIATARTWAKCPCKKHKKEARSAAAAANAAAASSSYAYYAASSAADVAYAAADAAYYAADAAYYAAYAAAAVAAADAAAYAADAAVADAAYAALKAEFEWQKQRLIDVLIYA